MSTDPPAAGSPLEGALFFAGIIGGMSSSSSFFFDSFRVNFGFLNAFGPVFSLVSFFSFFKLDEDFDFFPEVTRSFFGAFSVEAFETRMSRGPAFFTFFLGAASAFVVEATLSLRKSPSSLISNLAALYFIRPMSRGPSFFTTGSDFEACKEREPLNRSPRKSPSSLISNFAALYFIRPICRGPSFFSTFTSSTL
eukprot:UN24927